MNKLISILIVMLFCSEVYGLNRGQEFMIKLKEGADAWNSSSYENADCNDGWRLYHQDNPPYLWYGSMVIENGIVKGSWLYNIQGISGWGDFLSKKDKGVLCLNMNACYGYICTIQSRNVPSVDVSTLKNIGNDGYCLPYPWILLEYPMVSTSVCWAGYAVNAENGRIYWVGFGDCYADFEPAEIPEKFLNGYEEPPPEPPPVEEPEEPEPPPEPDFNYGSETVHVGDVDGGFSYDSNTGVGTISVNIDMRQENVEIPDNAYDVGTYTMSNKLPLSNGGETSDISDAVDDYIAYGSTTVNYIAKTHVKSVVNWILDMIMNHPVMSFFNNVDVIFANEFCEVSIPLFGKTIKFGFCDLDDELSMLRLVVIGIAGIYSVIIVLRGD